MFGRGFVTGTEKGREAEAKTGAAIPESGARAAGRWGLALGLTVAAGLATALVYPALPDRIPTHWNFRGEADAWGPRWTAFGVPIGMAAMLAIFAVLPRVSPRRYALDAFRDTYAAVVAITTGMFGYIQGVILAACLGAPIDMGRWLVGGLLAGMALLGTLLGKVRPNFWVGVRVPWTLASERVWNETHELAGRLLVLAGLAGIGLLALGASPVWAFALLLIAVFGPIPYSLALYKRLEREGKLGPGE